MKYSRTAPVKIIVIGAGGTGGYVIPHLYRLGYASGRPVRIIVCDGDIVEEKNLIRQNFVQQDIGQNKAQVQVQRYSAAFGIECEYIPDFIKSDEKLLKLTTPDFYARPYDRSTETQRVILLGCVDNNRSRQMCHRIFQQQKDLVYIDSGNGEHTGQVVCGIRQNGRTTYKPVGSLYPDVLKEEDKFPSELSCAERTVSAPQSVTANLTAATAMIGFLYNLLIVGELTTRYVTFSSKQINMRAELTKKRKRSKCTKSKERNRLCKSPENSLCPMRKANAESMV